MKLKDLLQAVKDKIDFFRDSEAVVQARWDELDDELYDLESKINELYEAIRKKEEEEGKKKEKKIVFVVGEVVEHEETDIIAVFSSREKAEEFIGRKENREKNLCIFPLQLDKE